jgi:hypothetical protein
MECLDIASYKTLSHQNNLTSWNPTSDVGLWYGGTFRHSLLRVAFNGTNFGDSPQLFGHTSTHSDCDETKTIGDGVISGFDTWVLMMAHFRYGPYASLSPDTSKVVTTMGRDDTSFRCDTANINNTEWSKRLTFKDCYAYPRDEDEYNALPTNSGRMLSSANRWPVPSSEVLYYELSDRVHVLNGSSWSQFAIPGISDKTRDTVIANYRDALEELPRQHGYKSYVMELDAKVFTYSDTVEGTWYWINIPGTLRRSRP